MWRVVYIAPNGSLAESLRKLLSNEGFLVSVRQVGMGEGSSCPYEVLVPQSEAREAYEAINGYLTSRSGRPTTPAKE